MLPAFDAILGHRSVHSFETGPVIADSLSDHHSFIRLAIETSIEEA